MANADCISVSLSSCTFLTFACATFIGDNVDREKSDAEQVAFCELF